MRGKILPSPGRGMANEGGARGRTDVCVCAREQKGEGDRRGARAGGMENGGARGRTDVCVCAEGRGG